MESGFGRVVNAWEQRKLGEVATYKNGTAHEEDVQDEGNFELVTLKSVSSEGIIQPSGKFLKYSDDNLPVGSLVMILSEQTPGAIGMTAVIEKNHYYVLNQRVAEIRSKPASVNANFLSNAINRNQQYFESRSAGTKVQNISKLSVLEFAFCVPCITEQDKISTLIALINNLLALHERKLELLKALKKAYLQQLFPENINKKPKLRFTGFTDNWKQRKLGNIISYEQPGAYIVKSVEYNDSYVTPVLTAGKSLLLGYTNEAFGLKEASPTNPVIIFDDFTTSVHLIDFPFKIKSSAMKLLAADDSNIGFDYALLLKKQKNPKSHERHWISQYANEKIAIPERNEQNAIGQLLLTLDHAIALHQRKLEAFRKLKKSYLQNLFV